MDHCFIDITTEFLSVAFHNILYYSSIYPNVIFESRKKYNIVVYTSVHPDINKYIENCLKMINECLKKEAITRVVFQITNTQNKPLIKFVFDFEKNRDYDDTLDAYLVQCEQSMRAFCLSLGATAHNFKTLPEDASFSIQIHTNESAALSLAVDPSLEHFPMIEVEDRNVETDYVIPLRHFSIKEYNISTFIEI